MHQLTLSQLQQHLHAGDFSCRTLIEHLLSRINQHNATLNCFLHINHDQALQQAQLADDAFRQDKASALTGLPIAHKDIFCTQQMPTTCASKMLANFIAPYESTVTAKLLDQGMICLGKTNMDEFAMGSSNESSYFGACKNPWDLNRVPGGSSGGSAAAVAALLVPAATGTDTGGSIRQPAAFCGITGLKPTYGRVSRWGMVAFASSLDQAGVMTRDAADAALLLQAMAGYDPKDSTSAYCPVPDYSACLTQSLAGKRIGLPKPMFENLQINLEPAIDLYKQLGASVHSVDLPHLALSVPAYYVITPAECSSNLSRFDGVRFGHRCHNPQDLQDLYQRSRSEGFGTEVKRRILMGTYTLSTGYYDAYYKKAQQIRRLIQHDFIEAFKQVDFLLGPCTPTPAFSLGEKQQDPLTMYLSDIYTIAVNLAGLPALALPCGQKQNLPIGLQLIGNFFDEALLLNAGHQLQQNSHWHKSIPAEFT
jgi:aspartyl-tRNA(Asn)/glutamyl-tRNA(Gln) amidotransferase subunit A